MAFYSIEPRQRADGSTRYRTTVRVKSKGKILYSQSRTFTNNAAASAWGKKEVLQLEVNGVPQNIDNPKKLHNIISDIKNDPHIKLGRTKSYVLDILADSEIGQMLIQDVQAKHIIEHCKNRKETGISASTVNHDLSYLSWVLQLAKIQYGLPTQDNASTDARMILKSQGVVGKSQRRSRRPTDIELEKLKTALNERSNKRGSIIPFVDILDFSILSCMRIGEICKIRWDDVDETQQAVIVRDRKDPRKKAGNHMLVPLLGGAWEILKHQPQTDERIFPYNERSVTAGFQRVRNQLGINDLRYHDLRREGASRLFEQGYAIDEVAQVTGHRNINTLWQVYTELFPQRLHKKALT